MNSSGYSDTPSILQAPLISAFIACILYGVVCTQTFAYYNRFPRDSMFIKTTVFSVCLLEGVHTGLLISVLDFYVVREGGDVDVLNLIYKGVGICYIFGYVSTYIVNMFYIWRIWIISSRSILSLIIATLSTARVAVEITFCTKSLFNNQWNLFTTSLRPIFLASAILCAIEDLWIALSMSYFLYQGRTSTTVCQSVISRCIRYTVGTGSLTFVLTIVIIVTMYTVPNITFICLVYVQFKIYSNSLLVSLNSRNPKRRRDPMRPDALPVLPETPISTSFTIVSPPYSPHPPPSSRDPVRPGWHWQTGDMHPYSVESFGHGDDTEGGGMMPASPMPVILELGLGRGQITESSKDI